MSKHHEPIYKDKNGVIVPNDAVVITGSNDYGVTPWGATVFRLHATGKLATDWEMPDRHRFESCHCDPPCEWEPLHGAFELVNQVVPETAEEGDTFTAFVYGVSDTYPQTYVYGPGYWFAKD